MRLRYKLFIVSILVISLSAYIRSYKINKWEHDLNFKIGDSVVVRFGMYEGCLGTILQESYSIPRTGRTGEYFPSKFAGYIIDLACQQKEVGNMFFRIDFLRHSK